MDSDWPHPDATRALNPVAMPDDVVLPTELPDWRGRPIDRCRGNSANMGEAAIPAPAMVRRAFFAVLLLTASAALADEAPAAAANSAFLAANAAKPGTVTRPSGLQYRIVRSGFGPRPGQGDVVRISYVMRLIDGRTVDSTPPSLPAALALSSVNMRGLAEALALMHVGDRWQLTIPAALGYGLRGAGDGAIPPGQTLLFDVTLVSTAAPQPGEVLGENPLMYWSNGREVGAAITIHP